MSRKPIIAIDGYAGCGKSTLAKALAEKLDLLYIDSGAMYRAVTWYLLQNHVDIHDEKAVAEAIKDLEIGFVRVNGGVHVTVNGEDVEKYIRSLEVSRAVSPVATLKVVRDKLVALQQKVGAQGGVVMDGRDIGTVVFPDADLKIFLTADLDTRVARRAADLAAQGKPVSLEQVRHNLLERDRIDSTRAIGPLRQAPDAIVMDNSHLTKKEQLDRAEKLIQLKMKDS